MHKLLAVPNHMLRTTPTAVPTVGDTSAATAVIAPVPAAASAEGTRSDASQGVEAVHSNSYFAWLGSLLSRCSALCFASSSKPPVAAKPSQ